MTVRHLAVPSYTDVAGGPWTPNSIAGCVGWWDVSDAGSFSYSSGSVVSQWNDKSSSGNNITQATVGNQPKRTGIQNGLSTLVFDSDDCMFKTGHTPICSSAATIFVVFKKTGTALSYESLPFQLSTTNVGNPLEWYNSDVYINNSYINAGGTLDVRNQTVWSTYTIRIADADDSCKIYKDGILLIDRSDMSTAWDVSGQKICLATRGDAFTHFTGELAEVVVYNTVLSTTDRQTIENYLMLKWMPWTPASVANLAGWWDASDASTITYGTGTQIASWIDKSPLAYTVSATPHANRRRDVNLINGLPAVINDHVSGIAALTRASVNINTLINSNGTDAMTFIVMQNTSGIIVPNFGALGSTYRYNFQGGSGSSYYDVVDVANGRLSGIIPFLLDVPFVLTLYRDSGAMGVRLNKTLTINRTGAGGTVGSDTGTLTIMADIYPRSGIYGEVIHVARYNATELATIEDYLMNKWIPVPFRFPNLVGWWDASDASTITHSGGAVSQWNDKSPNAKHVVQATAGAKPTTGTATVNGLNVLVFDGGDYLNYAGTTGLNVGSATVFVVCKETVEVANAGLIAAYDTTGSDYNNANAFLADTADAGAHFGGSRKIAGPGNSYVGGTGASPLGLYVNRFNSDGSVNIWKNGSAGWTATNVGPFGVAAGGWIIGGRYLSGAIYSDARLNGQIAEILVYNTSLLDSDRLTIESYLKAKWGTP